MTNNEGEIPKAEENEGSTTKGLSRRHTLLRSHVKATGQLEGSPMVRRNTVRNVESGPEQHAWAGGAAGLVAGLLLYPAETISMRYKVGGQSVLRNLDLSLYGLALAQDL